MRFPGEGEAEKENKNQSGRTQYYSGRVTKYLQESDAARFQDATAYICGSLEMVKDTRKVLAEKGVKPQGMKIELFN